MFSRLTLCISAVFSLTLLAVPATADEATTEKWEQGYMQCTGDCAKDYPFTEHTVKEFAGIREACIQGCGIVEQQALPGYRRCYLQCKDTFPYRHGMRAEFADFQRTCVEGCRNIEP